MTGRRWQPAQISLTSYGGPNGPPPTRAIISAWDLFHCIVHLGWFTGPGSTGATQPHEPTKSPQEGPGR